MKQDRLKLAIIGATGTAYKRVIPALIDSEHCVVSAIQGRDTDKLNSISKSFGIKNIITDPDQITTGDFDFVYLATPPFVHFETLQRISETKIPVICEKPLGDLSTDITALSRMFELYPKTHFMLGHHLRHQSAIALIRDLLRKLGRIRNVDMQWGYGINRNAHNYSWKKCKTKGGDALFDLGSHMIDLSLLLFGKPDYVLHDTRNNNVDNSSISLGYRGFEVNIHASHVTPFSKNALLITGEKGYIESENFFGESSAGSIVSVIQGIKETRTILPENPYRNEFEDFCKCLKGLSSRHHGSSLEDAIECMKIMRGINCPNSIPT